MKSALQLIKDTKLTTEQEKTLIELLLSFQTGETKPKAPQWPAFIADVYNGEFYFTAGLETMMGDKIFKERWESSRSKEDALTCAYKRLVETVNHYFNNKEAYNEI